MRIGVQGDPDLGVSEALAYDLWVDAMTQELGCVGVTEIVKPDTVQIGSANKTGERRGEAIGRPRAAIRTWADECAFR